MRVAPPLSPVRRGSAFPSHPPGKPSPPPRAPHRAQGGGTATPQSPPPDPKRESKSRPTRGIVTVSTRGINQDGVEVMSLRGSRPSYSAGDCRYSLRADYARPSPRPFARRGRRLLTPEIHQFESSERNSPMERCSDGRVASESPAAVATMSALGRVSAGQRAFKRTAAHGCGRAQVTTPPRP